jgi:hypothetical protein
MWRRAGACWACGCALGVDLLVAEAAAASPTVHVIDPARFQAECTTSGIVRLSRRAAAEPTDPLSLAAGHVLAVVCDGDNPPTRGTAAAGTLPAGRVLRVLQAEQTAAATWLVHGEPASPALLLENGKVASQVDFEERVSSRSLLAAKDKAGDRPPSAALTRTQTAQPPTTTHSLLYFLVPNFPYASTKQAGVRALCEFKQHPPQPQRPRIEPRDLFLRTCTALYNPTGW